jgi:hypothetical protein
LHVPLHPDVDLENWITNGFPGSAMPAFKDKLSDQERWDVLNYLKTVASTANGASSASGAPPAAPASAPSPTVAASADGVAPVLAAEIAATASPASARNSSTSSLTPTIVVQRTATATPPPGGDLRQHRPIGNLTAEIQIQPRIYQPAEVDVRLTDAAGQPPGDVRRVDVQVAMEGMDHGARGDVATAIGPGHYRVQAMLLAMEGPWWLALRVERADGHVDSAVFRVQVPRDSSTGAVSAMAERATTPVQIQDVAVYPSEISPSQIAVTAGHPVRLEVVYVDRPACGSTIHLTGQSLQTSVTPDGLAELPFTPDRTGQLRLTCSGSGLEAQIAGS